jgi:hypothetical protein
MNTVKGCDNLEARINHLRYKLHSVFQEQNELLNDKMLAISGVCQESCRF